MQKRFLLALALICIAIIGVSLDTSAAQKPADAKAVAEVLSGIVAADNAADLEAVISHYSDDAVLLPPNDKPVTGKAAVRARYEEGFRHFRFDIAYTSDETEIFGDWAFIRGTIRGRTIPRDETPGRTLNEKYVMILHREKSGWKISRLIWNGSDPLPQHS